jgi:membrane protein DedA with SNARE-associated domain
MLETIGGWIVNVIESLGYPGIALLMAIESACIPLPSEIIMPFSGYLVARGSLTLWGVTLAGAIGCVAGSIPAYYLGSLGGRPLIERYGRYVLISRRDLDMADRAFARYGEIIIFLGRLLPVVRTFIAFPAGVARMHMGRFILYTFAGSLIWCFALAYIGERLGENWHSIAPYFHRYDSVFAVVVAVIVVAYIWRHVREVRRGG